MNHENIDKIAQSAEDRLLLAKLWDKISNAIRRSIPGSTGFLSPREQEMARFLFGDYPGLATFGGYEGAERKILCWLPEYLEADWLRSEDSPLICLRATFFEGDHPSHRDFLGALMGAGISRECVGDILIGNGACDFFVTKEIAPYLLQNFCSAGRTKCRLSPIALSEISVPELKVLEIRDTLASLRLDRAISAGFRISRTAAHQYISAGKASVNSLPCEKPDKAVEEGMVLSVRGLGKIKLYSVGGQTKKGRISVLIHRYV